MTLEEHDQYLINLPNMGFYREVYKNSVRWDGIANIDNKRIIVYGCQGYGDIIQYARYFRYLKANVIVHCPLMLHSLMLTVPGVTEVVDKDDDVLPHHDYHILSMSLPFLLKTAEAEVPYITAKPLDVGEGFKIGIVWEGSPLHALNEKRNCPLSYFADLPGKLFMLGIGIHDERLVAGCEDIELFSVSRDDFKDTAELVAAMDVVVSVDTAVLHLAGAMGKTCYGLLCDEHDLRWKVANWYPSVKFIKQPIAGDWRTVFDVLLRQF